MKYIISLLSTIAFLLFYSCDLTNSVNDIEPLFVIEAEAAISDAVSSEFALTGMYAALRGVNGLEVYSASLMGISLFPTDPNDFRFDDQALLENEVTSSNGFVNIVYADYYVVINRANWVIEKVAELSDADFDNNRRAEIIGEAKFIRALSHFYLLRLYGHFYDRSSSLGIVLKTSPIRSSESFPRNSVEEVYTQIIADLDDALASAPEFNEHYFPSRTSAKALKAKVLLYMEDYVQAAAVAREIIDNTEDDYALTPTFNEIFESQTVNSDEILFALYSGGNEHSNIGNLFNPSSVTPITSSYGMLAYESVDVGGQLITLDGPRLDFILSLSDVDKHGKYPEVGVTQFYLRMADMYLVYAEAEIRANGDLSAAMDAINTIRSRAGVETYPDVTDADQLLELVRLEKLMELANEEQSWYDLVRYAWLDGGFDSGFMVSDHKASAISSIKFIWPIPRDSWSAAGGIVEQAPGY